MFSKNKFCIILQLFLLHVLSILCMYPVSGSAQGLTDPLWSHLYESKKNDVFYDVLEGNYGNLISVGVTNSKKGRKTDAILQIISKEGLLVKEKNFGSVGIDEISVLAKYGNGIVAAGKSNSRNTDNGDFDGWIFYMDYDFNIIWSLDIGDDSDEAILDVAIINGVIVAVGYKDDNPWILKIDKSGNIISNSVRQEEGYYATISYVENVLYFAGSDCYKCKDRDAKGFLHIFDLDFSPVEIVDFDIDYLNRISDSELRDDKLLLIGAVDLIDKPRSQAALAVIDLNNTKDITYKEYGGPWDDYAYDINYNTYLDKIFLCGKSKSFSKSKKEFYKAWIVELDTQLEFVSESYFGSDNDDAYYKSIVTSDGMLVAAGNNNKNAMVTAISNYAIEVPEADFTAIELIEVKIKDSGGNGYLDADEKAVISISIDNKGNEYFSNIKLCLDNTSLINTGVQVPDCFLIDRIAPLESYTIDIAVSAKSSVSTDDYIIPIKLNSYDIGEIQLKVIERQYVDLDLKVEEVLTSYDAATKQAVITHVLTIANNGNLNVADLSLEINETNGIKLITQSDIASLKAGSDMKVEISYEMDMNTASNSASVFYTLSGDNQSIINEYVPIDISEVRSQDQSYENEKEQKRIEAETIKIESLRRERAAELDKLNQITSTLKSRKGVLLQDDKKDIEINLEIAELTSNREEIVDNLIKDIINDHIFIKPYILESYLETYNDYQDIILLMDYNEETAFQSLDITVNDRILEEALDYNQDDLSLDIKEKADGAYVIEYKNRIRLNKGENKISFTSTFGEKAYASTSSLLVKKLIKKSNLHLISIGVPDITQEESFRLKYTAKDASDLVSLFESEELSDYINLTSQTFNTIETTGTDNIRDYIQNLDKDDYAPDDVIVFYISSHAYFSEDFNSLFVATSDYDYMRAEASSLRFNNDILDWLKRMPCNVILLLDICHSGSIINESESSDGGGSDATAQIIKYLDQSRRLRSNVNVISSSGSGEYSYEIDAVQNSAFMAAIKEAITTERFNCFSQDLYSDIDGNNAIQLEEFIEFLRLRVPCIVDEHIKGQSQNPNAILKSDYNLKFFPSTLK